MSLHVNDPSNCLQEGLVGRCDTWVIVKVLEEGTLVVLSLTSIHNANLVKVSRGMRIDDFDRA